MNKLYNKISVRISRVARQLVPFNQKYKPIGVCRAGSLTNGQKEVNSGEVIVHTVYPAVVTTLNISDDLYHACSDYWKPAKRVETSYVVAEVPHGRIHTDNENSVAIISRFNNLVGEVSLSLNEGKVIDPALNPVFGQRYFKSPVKIQGTVFSLLSGGAGINNISHWFIDVLPRLHLLQKSGLYEKIDWFLVPSLRYSYQTETLAMLGIPSEKLLAGDQHPHITADCIIASTAPRGSHTLLPTWLCDYIKSAFLPLADTGEAGVAAPARIYISRSDSNMRNVLNEEELVKELEQYGFEHVISSKLSIREKLNLFSRAEAVVSATGAGLVSILFCQPGTKVIEIFNEGFVIEPFYDIATKTGLDYDYIICPSKKKIRDAAKGQRENLYVDIAQLKKKLGKILQPAERT
ncbi:glycosyltransferase family 61 protein [Pontibacter beigongshangensis]|uniref:glycosyltransferase family 61 protein n=1 Tax=Pontibacter beigongshangensis TaxID=2574733 RepID=UPI00164F3C9A|nr:glycosyltransferase 61 family protein [Pontibacter beigongshangensis]